MVFLPPWQSHGKTHSPAKAANPALVIIPLVIPLIIIIPVVIIHFYRSDKFCVELKWNVSPLIKNLVSVISA